MAGSIRYRKLPGQRRGFIRGWSVWLGPDHLLAVSSMRFREEYKRYYFRDIQAIAVARKPRFHLSTRSAGIGYFWLIAFASLYRIPHGAMIMGAAGIALVAFWFCFSAFFSCTCRIHTAVSQDPLPSVYRIWSARKFLRLVEQEVSKVQGVPAQPLADFEATGVGPLYPATPEESVHKPPAESPVSRRTSWSFYLLLTALFADGFWHWFTMQHAFRRASIVASVLGIAEIALAIVILVQYRQKRVRPAYQRLAIATLVGTGLIYYGTSVGVGGFAGFRAVTTKKPVDAQPALRFAEKVNMGATLALGLVGLGILFAGKRADQEPRSSIT